MWGWHGEYENQTEGVGQGIGGRICLGKPCFSGFFRTSFNCSGAPEGEKNEDGRGDGLGTLNIKKKTQEREFLGPLRVII